MMKLTILGSCAASPSSIGFTSSQILQVNGASYLIDCGEGTQIQLRKNKIKFNTIEHIFISHLHGDHFFGLPGLISSLNLLGRKKPLNIYGPIGLKKAITFLLCARHLIIQPAPITPVPITVTFFMLDITCVLQV